GGRLHPAWGLVSRAGRSPPGARVQARAESSPITQIFGPLAILEVNESRVLRLVFHSAGRITVGLILRLRSDSVGCSRAKMSAYWRVSEITIRSRSLSVRRVPVAIDPYTKAASTSDATGASASRSGCASPIVLSTMLCSSPKIGEARLA